MNKTPTDLLIVAAGMGTRLQQHGPSKPLVKLEGTALIEHAMCAAANAGITRFVVVTGYLADQLGTFLKQLAERHGWQLELINNLDYRRSNGLSVLAAEPALPDCFYLAMCDHLVSTDIYQYLSMAEITQDQVGLALDYQLNNPNVDMEDVTRVRTKDSIATSAIESSFPGKVANIQQIGKHLDNYNAFDTGIFRSGPALFEALKITAADNGDSSISSAMQHLAASGNAIGVDIGQAFWIDVDSPTMYERAKTCLRQGDVTAGITQYQPAIAQIDESAANN